MNDVMKMILSLVVGFVIAELALRATDPLDVQYFVNVAEYQGHTVPHPKYSYINPPNAIITIDGTTYKFNAYGMRWGEIDQSRSGNSETENNRPAECRGFL